MSVGLKIGSVITEVGSAEFLNAFFSTVIYRLEPKGRGTRFPVLINELFEGKLDATHAEEAINELNVIQNELKSFAPDKVIWDIFDLKANPSWGDKISKDITDLSNYFVTSDGKDLIKVIRECLEWLKIKGGIMEIKGVGFVF